MKTINLLKKLEGFPAFTLNDVAKITGQTASYTRTLLYRLAKAKHVRKIERNKYTLHEDPVVFASFLFTPSYLSSWTALRLYNMTTQMPNWIFVMSPVPKKNIMLDGKTQITFVKTKHMWGYEKVRYGDFEIFVADKEKTIIDCLLTKIDSSDIMEAVVVEGMDFRKLVSYAEKTGNKALIKRLGFIMERTNNGGEELLKYVDSNYTHLDTHQKHGVNKNSRWMVKYRKEYDRFGRA